MCSTLLVTQSDLTAHTARWSGHNPGNSYNAAPSPDHNTALDSEINHQLLAIAIPILIGQATPKGLRVPAPEHCVAAAHDHPRGVELATWM
jgi:hypothetical protein